MLPDAHTHTHTPILELRTGTLPDNKAGVDVTGHSVQRLRRAYNSLFDLTGGWPSSGSVVSSVHP